MRRVLMSLGTCLTLAACGTEMTVPLPDAEPEHAARFDIVTTVVACGDLVTTDVRLEADLACPDDALIVDADGLRINLNGHTISGNNTGEGITVRGRANVTIYGGTVRNFTTGVFVAQSTGVVVKDNWFTANREGVFLNGASGNVVKSNVAWQNTLRGIMLRPTASGVPSTNNVVVGNTLTDNPSGILIFGQSGNTLKENTISGSTVGAFDLTGGGGSANEIKGNVLSSSAAGIKFGAGWNGNFIIGNTIQSNTCGLAGPSALNTYKDNVFTSNSTDICP